MIRKPVFLVLVDIRLLGCLLLPFLFVGPASAQGGDSGTNPKLAHIQRSLDQFIQSFVDAQKAINRGEDSVQSVSQLSKEIEELIPVEIDRRLLVPELMDRLLPFCPKRETNILFETQILVHPKNSSSTLFTAEVGLRLLRNFRDTIVIRSSKILFNDIKCYEIGSVITQIGASAIIFDNLMKETFSTNDYLLAMQDDCLQLYKWMVGQPSELWSIGSFPLEGPLKYFEFDSAFTYFLNVEFLGGRKYHGQFSTDGFETLLENRKSLGFEGMVLSVYREKGQPAPGVNSNSLIEIRDTVYSSRGPASQVDSFAISLLFRINGMKIEEIEENIFQLSGPSPLSPNHSEVDPLGGDGPLEKILTNVLTYIITGIIGFVALVLVAALNWKTRLEILFRKLFRLRKR